MLLHQVPDDQKVHFVTQQLLGPATAWWDNFRAMQPVGHRMTWQEFTTAFHEHFIPAGLMSRKLTEFLELKQGNMTVVDFTTKFNHLSQYAGHHVDTDEKKMDCFRRGLSCVLQEKLFTGGYQTFGALMSAAISMEGLQNNTQTEWKRKRGIAGSSSHPQAQKVQVVKRMPYYSQGGQQPRHTQQTSSVQYTQYRAPTQQVQQSQGQQFQPRQGQGAGHQLFVSSVARKVTMLGNVLRIS
jgi:hypothetical protein